MATINISDYNQPGIVIREIDDSVRQVAAQTTLINLVPGFSRKGPVNRPVQIDTPQQLYDIFGDIDRFLEKKGCFFHRTILNVLRNGPVWALNLLETDDNLDLLDWKTVSVASNVANGVVKNSAYSRFFNKSDFWYRDTESFISLANENLEDSRNLLHITNMSDRKVSTFIYKSSATGYDTTLEIWYGGKTNVPTYLHPTDLASDYIVSMLIVSGDWSDYKNLSVNTKWSKYFNPNGLRKDQVTNFANDASVNVLKYYSDLSLIPYFKAEANNANSRDIFIETVVNRDTDSTGIFVAYDIEKLEDSDYSLGLLDLVGSNMVGESDLDVIEYLSYKESISENISFTEQVLDRAGNAFGHEGLNIEGKLLSSLAFTDFIITTGSNSSEINLGISLDFILNGVVVSALDNSVTVNDVAIGKIRKDTLYFDANGNLGVQTGIEVSNQTQWNDVPLKPLASGVLPIAIVYVGSQGSNGAAGITAPIQVLAPIDFEVNNGTNSADILITYGINNASSNTVSFEFVGTKNTDSDYNYRKTRLNAIFNQLQSKLNVGTSIIKSVTGQKIVISDLTLNTSGSDNKALTIVVSPSLNINTSGTGGTPEIFYTDDELTFRSTTGAALGTKTEPSASTSGYGVVSQNSSLYAAYRDGLINTGDYFYPNLYNHVFPDVEVNNVSGNSVITLYYNTADNIVHSLMSGKIKLFGTLANDNVFTVLNLSLTDTTLTAQPLYTFDDRTYNLKLDIIVNEAIKTEAVLDGSITVHGANDSDITYLKMYFIGTNLTVQYCDKLLLPTSLSTVYNLSSIRVLSKKNNYKQTLEIEAVLALNKVLVNSARYNEIKIGDYLKAYVDEDALQPGEVAKNVTRIVSKKLYAGDSTLVEITTDAQIDVLTFGSDMQTFRYTSVESYVNTYNAIVLNGFKMRADSMPNGQEQRQNDILNVIAVNTPLFKGLCNRNKISWRYLIDPWANGLTANSKQQLVDLCGTKLTCFGILNMPSAKAFKNSTSTIFVNDDKSLNTEFIRLGGDPESSPSFLYTFAEGSGQSNVGYFFPFVTIDDNGRPLDMPPASFVANAFIRKHTTRLASVKPWTVVAGLTNGLLTGFGNVEMDLTPDDIGNLNLMNANPIVYKMNRGFVVETDNTAQVSPRSSLSYIHSREVLVELEEDMYQMLLTYQWRANTKDVRDEIKSKADAICQRYVRDNGLYDFYNVIDETNNTPEIIDAQIGVLDTYVEIIKNMSVIVNNITILKTGDIQAGGFR